MADTLPEQPQDEHQTAAQRLAAAVLTRAEAAGTVIGEEVRRETLALIVRLVEADLAALQTLNEFIREFRIILQRYEPVLARTLSDAHLASYLAGGQSILSMNPEWREVKAADPYLEVFDWQKALEPRLTPGPSPSSIRGRGELQPAPIVRFDIIREAAGDLAARKLLTPQDLLIENHQAQQTAFHAGRTAMLDTMEKVRNTLIDALVDGDSLKTWTAKVQNALQGSGVGVGRLERIFRNNVMFQYARGQKAIVENPLVRSVAAFAWRSEIRDSRLTYLCDCFSRSGIQGTSIYSIDDPVWRRVAPTSHFQ
jgi:hypothetical protein